MLSKNLNLFFFLVFVRSEIGSESVYKRREKREKKERTVCLFVCVFVCVCERERERERERECEREKGVENIQIFWRLHQNYDILLGIRGRQKGREAQTQKQCCSCCQ